MPRIRHLMLFLAVIAIAPVAGTLLRIGLKSGDAVTIGGAGLDPSEFERRCSMPRTRRRGAAARRGRGGRSATAALVVQAEARRPRHASTPSDRAPWSPRAPHRAAGRSTMTLR